VFFWTHYRLAMPPADINTHSTSNPLTLHTIYVTHSMMLKMPNVT